MSTPYISRRAWIEMTREKDNAPVDGNGFGLAHIRREGSPMHPDDFHNEDKMSDEQYLRQLQAYKDANPGSDDYKSCVRDRLLKDLR